MRDALTKALTWAFQLQPDPALWKWTAAVVGALFFGLVFFALIQYQTTERRWGVKLVLGLLGCATVVGLGTSAFLWITGALYGLGYLLTWLVWMLTRRWPWWRQALARGLTAGLTIGPWLWIGTTEKEFLIFAALLRCGLESYLAKLLVTPNALIWFWMLLGFLWLLTLVGGWGCWCWPLGRPGRRHWAVAIWLVMSVFGLNWYIAGRVALYATFTEGHNRRLGYVLVSRPGSQWYRWADGGTPLHYAAVQSDVPAMHILLAAGAKVTAKTSRTWLGLHGAAETPLHWAATNGHIEAIRLLLTAGADPSAKAEHGRTPLHFAALNGHFEAIRILLAAGADVHTKLDDGQTPLHWAVFNSRTKAIQFLLHAGADPNANEGADPTAKKNSGWTLLQWAANFDEVETLSLLLTAGARVNERKQDGQTALDVAKSDTCRTLLRRAGGKTGAELAAEKAKSPPTPTPTAQENMTKP